MPTPLGHAIGGLSAAFLANSFVRHRRLSTGTLMACAVVAVTPDLDLLVASHRTYTHSFGAVATIGLAAGLVARRQGLKALPVAIWIAAAYSSHLFLDWLGKDTSRPPGLTVFWPFSSEFYMSGLNLFGEVSRRYWLPDEFIVGNIKAVAWELVVLMPVLIVTWVLWSGRTLKGGRG